MRDGPTMTADDAVDAFAASGNDLPRDAMQWALDHWDQAGPRFLCLLDGYVCGTDTAERTERALFLMLHLLAERRETAAFGPLCRLLAEAEPAELILGDALSETLPRLFISLFDGNVTLLHDLVGSDLADFAVRGSALLAMAYLTRTGALPEDRMRPVLRQLLTELPQAEHPVWIGWVGAVAHLGYHDLAGDAETLIRRGLVPRDVMHVSHFRQDLRLTLDDPAGLAGFEAAGIRPFTDAIGTLAEWSAPAGEEEDEPPQQPIVNPMRGVGRNDPCPCGSGRKYKKCCLT